MSDGYYMKDVELASGVNVNVPENLPLPRFITNIRELFNDDFELGTAIGGWAVTDAGPTLARTTAAGEFWSGGAGAKITTSTTSADAGVIERNIHRPLGANRLWFGALFNSGDENLSNFQFRFGYRDGTNRYEGIIKYTVLANADTWQYEAGGAGASNFVTFLTRDLAEAGIAPPRWHTFLMGIDLGSKKFLHVSVDDTAVANETIQAVTLRTTADATLPGLLHFAIDTLNITGVPVASNLYIDNIYGYAYPR